MYVRFTQILFFFFSTILLTSQIQNKYQQCQHLSGSGSWKNPQNNKLPVFGTTGKYGYGNTVGEVQKSSSFLINSNSELLVCYGENFNREYDYTFLELKDQLWKFSISKRQWQFVKGRKGISYQFLTEFNETGVFDKAIQIGAKSSTKGWIDEDNNIITFFGGYGYSDFFEDMMNEMWRYNVSSNEYAIIRYNSNWDDIFFDPRDRYSNFTKINHFDSSNVPGARIGHEIIPINKKEVLLVGGDGYSTSSCCMKLADWYIFSSELMQWKYLGGDNADTKVFQIYGGTNVSHGLIYHPDNRIGSISYTSGILINSEEVFLFGGKRNYDFLSTIFKYNITSNCWKFVSGFQDFQETGKNTYGIGLRYYSSINIPGARSGHKLWRFNENELLLFGGYGYPTTYDTTTPKGYLNDEWRYDINTNFWIFKGKEKTLLQDNTPVYEDPCNLDKVLVGGIMNFNGQYNPKNKELIICNGKSYYEDEDNQSHEINADDCWRIFYGHKCDLIEDIDPTVCSGKGICSNHNFCSCFDGYFGLRCELTKCNGILSNETDTVCSGKGFCYESKCLCYVPSIYNNPDCTIDEEQQIADQEYQQFLETLWIYLLVPVVIILLVVFFTIFLLFFCFICCKQKQKLKKLDGIDNLDIILEEAKIDQNSAKGPKINIDKSLFEIDYKDIELISILGEGGQSTCFLCQWRGNFCAYKSFSKTNYSINDELFGDFEKEVKVFSSINHPSILQFYGACVNLPHVGILLQYCQFGDLNSFLSKYHIKNKKKYAIGEKIRILREIASGMQYLHSLKVLHRDLKPENILVDDNEHSKIMDFGLSKFSANEEKTMTKQIGTSYYMAPEVFLENQKYSMKCDVYSFAVLTLVIITENYFPYGIGFNASNQNLLLKRISNNANFRPEINKEAFGNYQSLIEFIKRNWNSDPNQRNSFEEIVPILKKLEKQDKKQENLIQKENWKEKYDELFFKYTKHVNRSENTIKHLKEENQNLKLKYKQLESDVNSIKRRGRVSRNTLEKNKPFRPKIKPKRSNKRRIKPFISGK